MHKLLLALLVSFGSVAARAQFIDFAQSSPSLKWQSISNESVRVIYPDYLQGESVYIANLVEHYSKFVGQTYGIKNPKQFDLIIRAETGEPNGYVTLMPRRSEWFSSSMFFPGVGSLDWYQALSIHEYRHVNQFDYFNQGATKGLYWVMGEFGEIVATFLAVPSWYMEGDAVWTETKFTDAGRGRSPRFLARLKALITSDQIPTFDELLSGTYRTNTPNHYVFGYALISYGVQKYGEELWPAVMKSTARFPYPLSFYNAFSRVTGQSFQSFYDEAMNDLKTKWAKDSAPKGELKSEYREILSPAMVGDSTYVIAYDLNSQHTIYKVKGDEMTKIVELPFISDFMSINFGKDKAVTTEFLPSPRFQHRNYSDLVVYDLKSGSKDKLTNGERLYNPRFNAEQNRIIATEFTSHNMWNLAEFDVHGKKLRSFGVPEGKVEEAYYLDNDNAIAILGSKAGLRSIVVIDLKAHKVTKTLLPPSRNLIYSLNVDRNKNIFFEGQYKGRTEIFKLDQQGAAAKCSLSRLGSYTPSSNGEVVTYSDMDSYGSRVIEMPIANCQTIAASELVDYKYLSDDPSDNYNAFPLQPIKDQESLYIQNKEQYKPEDYDGFDKGLIIPHSWGLTIGRGAGLGFATDNYLRTMGLSAIVGTDAEEGQGYANLAFDLKKYYPVFRFEVEERKRKVKDFETQVENKWTEDSAGLTMIVPYIKKRGLYNFQTAATLSGAYTNTDKYEVNDLEIDGSNYFYKSSAGLAFAWSKDPSARSLQAPWLLSYAVKFDNADSPSDDAADGYRVFQAAILQTPSIFANDGFKFEFDQQNRDTKPGSYRFLPVGVSAVSYVFSRGYTYEDVPGYQKVSANYLFPIAYPDFTFGGMFTSWLYLKRIYGNAFYDTTFVQDTRMEPSTLNSYGLEMLFEAKLFRFLPLTGGVRVLERLSDNVVVGEAFLASGVGF